MVPSWPSAVREVEIEVIGLSQRVQVSGVEFKDIRSVKGAQRGHFESCLGEMTWM
jgi:hypothetical protein